MLVLWNAKKSQNVSLSQILHLYDSPTINLIHVFHWIVARQREGTSTGQHFGSRGCKTSARSMEWMWGLLNLFISSLKHYHFCMHSEIWNFCKDISFRPQLIIDEVQTGGGATGKTWNKESELWSIFRKDVDARALQPERWDRRGHLQQENALRRNLSQGRMPFLICTVSVYPYLYSPPEESVTR